MGSRHHGVKQGVGVPGAEIRQEQVPVIRVLRDRHGQYSFGPR